MALTRQKFGRGDPVWRATRQSPPVARRAAGSSSKPKSETQKLKIPTPSPSAPNARPSALAPFRPPNHRKSPPARFRAHSLEIKMLHDSAKIDHPDPDFSPSTGVT